MPPLQAMIIDQETFLGMMGARASFLLPTICFVVVALYGWSASRSRSGASSS